MKTLFTAMRACYVARARIARLALNQAGTSLFAIDISFTGMQTTGNTVFIFTESDIPCAGFIKTQELTSARFRTVDVILTGF